MVGAVGKIFAFQPQGPQFNLRLCRDLNLWGTFFSVQANSACHLSEFVLISEYVSIFLELTCDRIFYHPEKSDTLWDHVNEVKDASPRIAAFHNHSYFFLFFFYFLCCDRCPIFLNYRTHRPNSLTRMVWVTCEITNSQPRDNEDLTERPIMHAICQKNRIVLTHLSTCMIWIITREDEVREWILHIDLRVIYRVIYRVISI